MYQFSYNGYTIQVDDNRVIDQVTGLGRVDTRVSQDLLTGADGGNIWERKLGFRTITIAGEIFSTTLSDYYNQRANFQTAFAITSTNNTLTIVRPDGVTKTIQAKVVDIPDFIETPGEFAEAHFNVVLRCEDPYFQDAADTTGTLTPGFTGGMPVPSPIPMPIGGVGTTLTLINASAIPLTPSFTITGTIVNPMVTNTTTGQSFQFNTTIALGETLLFYKTQQGIFATKNGVNQLQYLSGDLFDLQVGSNTLTFNGSSYDTNSLLSVSFRNKYINI